MIGRTSPREARSRRPLVVGVLALVGAALVTSLSPLSAPAETASPAKKADGFSETKTLTRVFTNADGSTYEFPSNTVTVKADQTKNLRGRQRINISWSGAQPSGGRANNPYGENGLQQEYPVLVMQCRGVDDPSLPADKQIQPSTCWTTSFSQRSQLTKDDAEAAWTHDLDATPEDKARLSGVAPFPGADVCPGGDIAPYFSHLTPFVARKGTVYPACSSTTMPPEAAVGAAFPAHEVAAFTDTDGTGSVKFEVRSDVENESLGCSEKVACSVVVVPINGLSCDQPSDPPTVADDACRKGGRFLPGSSNFANEGVDQAVSPTLWWSASNWKNRFSIPITFGLPPDTCDVLDPRPPTGFYGSELLAQAALQWSPAYCLNKKRFKFQLNQMSDEAGFTLMENGGGAAAEVSSAHERKGEDPVGYAPTAATGFSIGYVIDRPNNGGEYGNLRLNARLLAKLYTQSYLGSDLGRGHPGIGNNPLAIMNDPEFIKLNPGLSQITQEAGATLLSLSNSSDVIEQITEYIASDKGAMDWINGKPDPWGMKVNPAYKKISLPRPEWPLLDTYVPKTENTCRQKNPAVYFTQLAAPVTTMRKIAEALLDAWPNVQTRCDFDQSTQLYKLGRIDRQSYGARFMLGVVSLGDAERYGLQSASLETKPGQYVGPSDASLGAAIELAKQQQPGTKGDGGKGDGGKGDGGKGDGGKGGKGDGGKGDGGNGGKNDRSVAKPAADAADPTYGPFILDQEDVRKSGKAYPGTMVVYTAARLRNLLQDDADKVAQFIDVSTTEGQRAGTGNGELPAGFLPIEKSGVTKKLYVAAQAVAKAVEAQKPAPTPKPTPTPTPTPTSTGGGGGGNSGGGGGGSTLPAPADDTPSEVPSAAPTTPAATTEATPVAMPATQPVGSAVGGRLLPGLLVIGLLGIAVASGVRFAASRPRQR